MSDNQHTTRGQDAHLGNFAAELTSAAYRLVLRQGFDGSWLQVELALWEALTEAVATWARRRPPALPSDEFAAWRAGLLADLIDRTLAVALENGVEGSILTLELDLERVFRRVLGGRSHDRDRD
jgi:hypothetical protein